MVEDGEGKENRRRIYLEGIVGIIPGSLLSNERTGKEEKGISLSDTRK